MIWDGQHKKRVLNYDFETDVESTLAFLGNCFFRSWFGKVSIKVKGKSRTTIIFWYKQLKSSSSKVFLNLSSLQLLNQPSLVKKPHWNQQTSHMALVWKSSQWDSSKHKHKRKAKVVKQCKMMIKVLISLPSFCYSQNN